VRSSRYTPRIFAIAFLLWSLDFLTKNYAINHFATEKKILGDFLTFTLLRNPGAAFSFATGMTILFTLFACAVGIVIIRYASRVTSLGWAVVGGLVLGGVLGNLTDRFFRSPGFLKGHVIDWIQLPHWPVFNLADSAIVCAACIATVLTARNISPIQKVEQ
jgi:signal peptidase II